MRKGTLILSLVISGIYAVSAWSSTGHWPPSWIVVLIGVGVWGIGTVADSVQTIAFAISQIHEQNEEIKEKIEQMEDSISTIEGRLPRQRSLLDEY